MESQSYKDEDDGYRGWLRNPVNGRVFRANAITARRTDLLRIASPFDTESRVETSRAKDIPAQEVIQPRKPSPEEEAKQASEAEQAIKDLLLQARGTKDKGELKVIGAQLGVKLTSTMNPETMRDRIEKQVEAIQAATR